MTKLQLTLDHLKKIIYNAETVVKKDNSLSSTLEFTLERETDTHTGSDEVTVFVKSSYAECIGREIWSA